MAQALNRMDRVIDTILSVPCDGSTKTTGEICAELYAIGHVTTDRTVQRDLLSLSRYGVRRVSVSRADGGCLWARDRPMESP